MKKILAILFITVLMISLCSAESRLDFLEPGDDTQVVPIRGNIQLLPVSVTTCVNAENAENMAGTSKVMHGNNEYLEIGWVWGPDNVVEIQIVPPMVMTDGTWKYSIVEGLIPDGVIAFKLDW